MKTKELRELSNDELSKKILDMKIELKNLRFSKARGENKNPLKRRNVKREIAKMLTIKKEKGWN
ncbi:50S ribosomal protein L29 [Candidatus Saganbacteria bacterium]|nr:50S ribosomal protein L29 [Candidatus Saganbacteria bacterium]